MSLSSDSEIPFKVLPSIIPNNGIEYCGAYHGSVLMMVIKVKNVNENEDTNMDNDPRVNPQ